MAINDAERWERLAALGFKREIPTPEGQARMSAVILQLAEPLIKQHAKTVERAKAIISLVVAGWNKSLILPDKRPLVEKELIDRFVPKDGSAATVGTVIHVMDLIGDRRAKEFPDFNKVIVDYKIEASGDTLTLNISSAPIPDLERAENGAKE